MGIFYLSMNVFSFVEGINTLSAVLFILGLLLLIVEMFIPGFGIAGGSGLVLLVVAIILTARTPFEAFVMLVIVLILVTLVLAVILRSAKRGKLSRKLILWSSEKHENGFRSTEDMSTLLDREGVALTVLRPAGTGSFEGRRLDVVSDGNFIEKGIRIKIVRIDGRRILVERID